VNSCLYFDGTGQINQIVGGYDDVDSYLALKQLERQNMADGAEKKVQQNKQKDNKVIQSGNTATDSLSKNKKLSFKEARELESLPGKIDELENLIDVLQAQVNEADFFSQDEAITKKVLNQLSDYESNLEVVYARWQELDD
jgi:ATP-binding cassette subfamily F protein uup